MATKTPIQESKQDSKEFIIPLRKSFIKVPQYRRSGRAIKQIKQYIAKHLKVPNRDSTKVKLDVYLNSEVLHKGRRKPPAKIKVIAQKSSDSDNINVRLAMLPQKLKFLKSKHSRLHKKEEKKVETPPTPQTAPAPATIQTPQPIQNTKETQSPAPSTSIPQLTQTPSQDSSTSDKKSSPEKLSEEKEKAQSSAEQNIKQAEQSAKAEKHLAKGQSPQVQRKALKK